MDINNKNTVLEYLDRYEMLEKFLEDVETGGRGANARTESLIFYTVNNNGNHSKHIVIDVNNDLAQKIFVLVNKELGVIKEELADL